MVAVQASAVTFAPCGKIPQWDGKTPQTFPALQLDVLLGNLRSWITWPCNPVTGQIVSRGFSFKPPRVYLYESQVVRSPIRVNLFCGCWLFALQPGWNVKDEYAVVVSPQVHCEYVEAQLLADAFHSLRIPLRFWWEAYGNTQSSWSRTLTLGSFVAQSGPNCNDIITFFSPSRLCKN